MDASFCVEALKEALARYGKPKIFNTDQGSEFTSSDFTGALAAAGIKISMDGTRPLDGERFIERLWRCLKHEDVYLKGYADGRFHQALEIGRQWQSGARTRPLQRAAGLRI
jgi:putative transposase